jgi:hypothetical protein
MKAISELPRCFDAPPANHLNAKSYTRVSRGTKLAQQSALNRPLERSKISSG